MVMRMWVGETPVVGVAPVVADWGEVARAVVATAAADSAAAG